MKPQRVMISVFLAAFFMWSMTAAYAQQLDKPPKEEREKFHKEKMEKIRAKISMILMWRLTDLLELDEATGAKFYPILKEHDTKMAELHKMTNETRMALKAELGKEKPDGDTVQKMVTTLRDLKKKMDALDDEQITKAAKVLTPVQLGKLVLFFPKLQREIQGIIQDAKRGKPIKDFREDKHPPFDKGPDFKPQDDQPPPEDEPGMVPFEDGNPSPFEEDLPAPSME